jgi:hypothetical protein
MLVIVKDDMSIPVTANISNFQYAEHESAHAPGQQLKADHESQPTMNEIDVLAPTHPVGNVGDSGASVDAARKRLGLAVPEASEARLVPWSRIPT